MARRVDEADLLTALEFDLIGTDVLGDTAGLAAHYVGGTQRIQQRGLAVINMAHDCNNRRPRLAVARVVLDTGAQVELHIRGGGKLRRVAEFLDDELGRLLIDGLVDGRHNAELHQRLDDLRAALGHTVGQLADGNRVRDRDLTNNLDRTTGTAAVARTLLTLPLLLAAKCRHGTLPRATLVIQCLGNS